ncbi:MAG TPA: ACT domain-containing protein, partial [Anaeromyxobacteraceae bacterium]
MSFESQAILLIKCPDRPGIVAAISSFLFRHGANITDLDQHSTEEDPGVYFMRLELQTAKLNLPLDELRQTFEDQVGRPFGMSFSLSAAQPSKRVAVLVSKHDHALMELLWEWKHGDLPAEVVGVVSNHPDLGPAVESLGVPFHHVPNTKD